LNIATSNSGAVFIEQYPHKRIHCFTDHYMCFSTSQTTDALSIWSAFVRPTLGAAAHRQFVRATATQLHGLVQRVIKPNLFQTDPFGAWYIPVDLDAYAPGRNHRLAESLANESDPHQFYGGDPCTGLSLFANPLRACEPSFDDVTKEESWEPPSRRVVLGAHQVFTFEFDVPSVVPEQQLSWLRSS
jgi:hypothetical protein